MSEPVTVVVSQGRGESLGDTARRLAAIAGVAVSPTATDAEVLTALVTAAKNGVQTDIAAAAVTARLTGAERFLHGTGVGTGRQIRMLGGSPIIDRCREVCVIGTSHSAGSANGNSWYNKMLSRSRGKYRNRGNFAQGGYTIAQIRDVQVAQAIASGARICFVEFGPNSFPATTQANARIEAKAVLDNLIAGGVEPVVLQLYPRSGANAPENVKFNIWLQLYCRRNNILFIPTFEMLATPAGLYESSKFINESGSYLHLTTPAAGEVADRVDGWVENPRVAPLLALTDTAADNYNYFQSACSWGAGSTPTSHTGVAAGGQIGSINWYAMSPGTAGTYDIVAPGAGEYGNWLQWAVSGSNIGVQAQGLTQASINWASGHAIEVGMNVKWEDSSQALTVDSQFTTVTMDSQIMIQAEKGGTSGENGHRYAEKSLTNSGVVGFNIRGTGTATKLAINRPIAVSRTLLGIA